MCNKCVTTDTYASTLPQSNRSTNLQYHTKWISFDFSDWQMDQVRPLRGQHFRRPGQTQRPHRRVRRRPPASQHRPCLPGMLTSLYTSQHCHYIWPYRQQSACAETSPSTGGFTSRGWYTTWARSWPCTGSRSGRWVSCPLTSFAFFYQNIRICRLSATLGRWGASLSPRSSSSTRLSKTIRTWKTRDTSTSSV